MTNTPTPEELIDRARDVARIFAEQAARSETLRRPTDEAMTAAEDAQLIIVHLEPVSE